MSEKARRSCVNVLLTVADAPVAASDEFSLIARSMTDGFSVGEPIVIGQHSLNGGQCLKVQVPIFPSPPPAPVPSGPARKPFQDGWPEAPDAFGRAIRQAREGAGWSQARLAKRVGISESSIRNIESAKHVARPQVRRELIQALDEATQAQRSEEP